MGLELGLDLLAFGGEVFHSTILHLLNVAYELLHRKEFAIILAVILIFSTFCKIVVVCPYFYSGPFEK
jgi:hypothetical protein